MKLTNKQIITGVLGVALLLGAYSNSNTVGNGTNYYKEDIKEQQERIEDTTPSEGPKEEEVTPQEQATPSKTKEEVSQTIEDTIADSMGSNYSVEVVMYDDYTCNIGIMDNTTSYSSLSKEVIKQQCETYGLTDNAAGIASNAQVAFEEAGYPGITATVMLAGSDGVFFMMVNSTGYAIYY